MSHYGRIIGVLSSAVPKGSIYSGLGKFLGNKEETYGREYSWDTLLSHLQKCKLVFLGEIHSVREICAFQVQIVEALTPNKSDSGSSPAGRKLHIVMEHFSFEMQEIMDEFSRGQMSVPELLKEYSNGSEGHQLEPYRPLLEHIQAHYPRVRLHAGFISKQYARKLMKDGEKAALESAKHWMPPNLTTLTGSPFHYNYFESLLTGRDMHSWGTAKPSDRYQTIFKAQLIKDVAMAERINRLIDEEDDDDQIIVIAGNGHVQYYQGVPERVLEVYPDLVDATCLVTCHGVEESIHLLSKESAERLVGDLPFGPAGTNPADFVFIFSEENAETAAPANEVKAETRAAYDKVGATAHMEGNLKRAHAIMQYLGYSAQEIELASADAYNFQGVGNPHKHACIQPGETVLDVGSGLGVDSFIAASKSGPGGKVVGIDISTREVAHAQRRVEERGLENLVFRTADMERLPFENNSFDVVLSNGAFCLAPNKEQAFAEVYRVLKPGGRMIICTSTLQSEGLGGDVEWPVCMRMFIPKKQIRPICERLGFTDVVVDENDSKMVFELPLLDGESELSAERHGVHGNNPAFSHLDQYDMNELCARVVVVARKGNVPHLNQILA